MCLLMRKRTIRGALLGPFAFVPERLVDGCFESQNSPSLPAAEGVRGRENGWQTEAGKRITGRG